MVRVEKLIIATVFLLFIGFISMAQNSDNAFIWGVNGHPLTQPDYSKNLDEQIQAIKDLNLSSYRFDVILNQDGYAKNEPAFLKVLNSLKTNDILPLPAVMQTGMGSDDPDLIYKKGVEQGKNFGTRYGEYLSVLEVNNEGDNKIRLKNKAEAGGQSAEYDADKAKRFIPEIKGFIDGIKSVKPAI